MKARAHPVLAQLRQHGAGRTGKMWAIEHFGVQPDVVTAAKGIASGLPLGVTIARSEVMAWHAGPTLLEHLEAVEIELSKQAMEMCGGNLTQAAKLLDISRDQLRYKLKKSGEYRVPTDNGRG